MVKLRRRPRLMSATGALTCASTLLLLAACSSGTTSGSGSQAAASSTKSGLQALIDGAQKEGGLTWYNSDAPATNSAVQAAFEKAYPGVKLNVVRLDPSPLESRYATEESSGQVQADVVTFAGASFFTSGESKGWFAKLTSKEVPSVANWTSLGAANWNGQVATVGVAPIGWVNNSSRVKQPGTTTTVTWQALLNSRYKGQLALTNPELAGPWLDLVYFWYKTYGPGFLKDIRNQGFKVIDDAITGVQSVAAGQYGTLLFDSGAAYNGLITANAPVKFFRPAATTGVVYQQSMSAKAPHPDAAKLFMNWMMSQQGQEVFNGAPAGKGTVSQASVLPNVPGTVPLGSGYVAPDDPAAQAMKSTLMSLLGVPPNS
jgi:iron(III) transport system substrate-binding protein